MSTSLKDDVRKAAEYSPSIEWIPPIEEGNRNTTSHAVHDFKEKVCGKKYNVGFEIDEYHSIQWVRGTLMNYKSGNLDIETDDGYVVHIPYSGLKWLLPAKQER